MALLLAAAALLAGCEADAPDPDRYLLVPSAELPALSGRVVDNADLIPARDEARLSRLAADLERRTGDQFVLVTVPSLNGRPIDEFGLSLGRLWRIGQAPLNNGILLIVAPSERRVRIEVGCGLERVMPDEEAHDIIQQNILPHFREGAMAAGIAGGSEAIVEMLVARAGTVRGGDC